MTEKNCHQANDRRNFNCGPAAVCAVTGLTPEEIRPFLGDFEQKGYTNPRLMNQILVSLRIEHKQVFRTEEEHQTFPTKDGVNLVRIQWAGPWTNPGVPMMARYRHTHWIAVLQYQNTIGVFDINAMSSGGWISYEDWATHVVPWIIKTVVPGGTGQWWPTHVIQLQHAHEAGERVREEGR